MAAGIKETVENILLPEAAIEGTYVYIDQKNSERQSIYPNCIINSVAITATIDNKLQYYRKPLALIRRQNRFTNMLKYKFLHKINIS